MCGGDRAASNRRRIDELGDRGAEGTEGAVERGTRRRKVGPSKKHEGPAVCVIKGRRHADEGRRAARIIVGEVEARRGERATRRRRHAVGVADGGSDHPLCWGRRAQAAVESRPEPETRRAEASAAVGSDAADGGSLREGRRRRAHPSFQSKDACRRTPGLGRLVAEGPAGARIRATDDSGTTGVVPIGHRRRRRRGARVAGDERRAAGRGRSHRRDEAPPASSRRRRPTQAEHTVAVELELAARAGVEVRCGWWGSGSSGGGGGGGAVLQFDATRQGCDPSGAKPTPPTRSGAASCVSVRGRRCRRAGRRREGERHRRAARRRRAAPTSGTVVAAEVSAPLAARCSERQCGDERGRRPQAAEEAGGSPS